MFFLYLSSTAVSLGHILSSEECAVSIWVCGLCLLYVMQLMPLNYEFMALHSFSL